MPRPRAYASSAARQAAYRARCAQARQDTLLKQGLPKLPTISTFPGWARWKASMTAAHALLGQVSMEMQDYYDARSESWQESERAAAFTEHQQALEALTDELHSLLL